MRLKLDLNPVSPQGSKTPFDDRDAILDGFVAIQASGLVNLPQSTKDWIARSVAAKKTPKLGRNKP